MDSILFVCMGNTCRSAMAQAIARARYNDMTFDSAGLAAAQGAPASANAVTAAAEYGGNLSCHTARRLTAQMLMRYGAVVLLADGYAQYIPALPNVYPPSYFGFTDITDPYGGDIDRYRRCAAQIAAYVDAVHEKLKNVCKPCG